MNKYSTIKKKPTKKLVTINIDLDDQSSEEDIAIKELVKQGNDLIDTIKGIEAKKLERLNSEIVKTKQDIEDLKQ